MSTTEERISALEAHKDNIYHELSEIHNEVKDIHKLASAVEIIATKTESIDKKLDGVSERVSAVEKEPAENFKHLKQTIIGCVVTGVLSVILTAFLAIIIK